MRLGIILYKSLTKMEEREHNVPHFLDLNPVVLAVVNSRYTLA